MIAAIDPGMKGAVAWLQDDGSLVAVVDLPLVDKAVSPALLAGMLRQIPVRLFVVERQQSMPKQGVASSFKNGMGYGVILGVVAGLGVRWELVSSTVWKKRLGLTSDKEKSRQAALARWPEQSDFFKRKMDEGRAEAALLALSYLRDGAGIEEPLRVQKAQKRLVKVR